MTGLSIRSVSSMKFGMLVAFVPEQALQVGMVADQLERGTQEADCRLLSGCEQIGCDPHDVGHLAASTRPGTSRWRGR